MMRSMTIGLALAGLAAGCGAQQEANAPATDAPPSADAPAVVAEFTPEERAFRDWRAVCDNAGRCSAYGANGLSTGWIILSRDAGAEAPLRVVAGQAAWDEEEAGAPPRLTLDGRAIQLPREPDRTLALARDLAQGRTLSIGVNDQAVEVSLAGAAAALLWIDERQGRLGTPGTVMRPGDAAADGVPGPAPLPVVTAVRAPAQTGIPQSGLTLPPPLQRLPEVRACLDELWPGAEPIHSAAHLSDGVYLWGVECFRGAYNLGQRFWITGEDGADPRPANLPTASGEATNELVNAAFDPASGTLDAFARGRGLGDCGVIQEWAWTGQAFVLTREVSMPECAGMSAEHWPALYRTRER